jgi:hypothetical protein
METMYIYLRYRIMIEGSYNNQKKKVPLSQAQIAHFNFHAAKAFEQIVQRQTGQIIVEGIAAEGWTVVVMPYWRNDCNNTTVGRGKMVRGSGPNVIVGFQPDAPCLVDPTTKDFKPGGSPAEALFHELVHAFRFVTEKASNRKGPSVAPGSPVKYPEYDTEEDFFTILITNIFSSETGRPLRAGHDGTEALPPSLSTDTGFLAVEAYARLVKQFISDHPEVSKQLWNVRSAFNPIASVLSGQAYLRSLEYPAGALCGRPEEPDPAPTLYHPLS